MATLLSRNCLCGSLHGAAKLPEVSKRCFAAAAAAGLLPSRPAGAGGGQASGAGSAAAVRWPFIRSKALMAGISRALAPGPAASPRRLWILGAKGSGAGTAVQAAAAQAMRAPDGTVAATIVFDCATGGPEETAPKLFQRFEDMLQRQLAERFEHIKAPAHEQLVAAVVEAVLSRHPEAASGLVKVVEAVAARMGLANVLPRGIDVPACRDALVKHRDAPVALVVHAAEAILASRPRQQRQSFMPATLLHVVLVMLREAGMASSSSEYLLTSVARIAQITGRDVLLVLLRAEVLSSRSATLSTMPASKTEPNAMTSDGLLRMIESRVSEVGLTDFSEDTSTPGGRFRLLLQSRDMVAALRAQARGDEVMTVDEWSKDMAHALFVPRFLEPESEAAWTGIWAAVGGHAAHLRQIAENLMDEKRRFEQEKFQEEMEKQQAEALRSKRPERSPDAERFGKEADQQHEDDSVRADARTPLSVGERLLQKLPQIFSKEINAFEQQAAALLQHPLLQVSSSSGQRIADLIGKLQTICAQPYTPAPAGGFAELQDPVLLALLDVGLLVPKWSGTDGPRLVFANQLSRSLLISWVDAQCAELPWLQWVECRWLLWRKSKALAGSLAVDSSGAPVSAPEMVASGSMLSQAQRG